jgi:hypothetical protein
MRDFILYWEKLGYKKQFGGIVVNFADDLVICCKRDAEGALRAMRGIMRGLGLTVNEEKTKVVHMPKGKFVFLGYEFCKIYSWNLKKMFIGLRPSQKAITKLWGKIHTLTAANMGCKETSDIVKALNPVLRGWVNFFDVGSVSKAFRMTSRYAIGRLRHWLGRKHKWKTKKYKQYTDKKLYDETGLIDIVKLIPSYSWAKS